MQWVQWNTQLSEDSSHTTVSVSKAKSVSKSENSEISLNLSIISHVLMDIWECIQMIEMPQ